MTTVTFWFLYFWKYCFGTNGTPEDVVLPSGSEFVNYFLRLLAIFFVNENYLFSRERKCQTEFPRRQCMA